MNNLHLIKYKFEFILEKILLLLLFFILIIRQFLLIEFPFDKKRILLLIK